MTEPGQPETENSNAELDQIEESLAALGDGQEQSLAQRADALEGIHAGLDSALSSDNDS